MMPMGPTTLEELLDREAIRDCLMRYCRGIDRIDPEMIESAYWPGAIDDHGNFRGTVAEFLTFAADRLREMDQTTHFIGNILIELQGESAHVETYFDAYHRMSRADGSRYDLSTAGRYVDRFEKRGGEWRIADRVVAWDWFREYPESADWERGVLGLKFRSSRKPEDPIYNRT